MSINLPDTVNRYLSPDFISRASTLLGEKEGAVSKALSGVVPSIFSGIISKATSPGTKSADEILNTAKESHGSGMLANPGSLVTNSGMLNKGAGMMEGLFGDKLNGIISIVASYAGIKNSSAGSLFSLAAPVAMATVGKHALDNNLTASGLSSFLANQKANVANMLPAGLSGITSMPGFGRAEESIPAIPGNRKNDTAYTVNNNKVIVRKAGKMNALLWVFLFIIAALAAWYFLLGGKSSGTNTGVASGDTTVVNTNRPDTVSTTVAPSVSREMIKARLPDGVEIEGYKGGIEDRLVTFLVTDWAILGNDSLKKTWFAFDELSFKNGSAAFTPEGLRQVNNIESILKAFPKARLRIGGYTDKSGNEEINKKLSAARAGAVKAELINADLSSQVEGAEGYGSQFAKYPSSAPESDRVKDRHVSVSVRQ